MREMNLITIERFEDYPDHTDHDYVFCWRSRENEAVNRHGRTPEQQEIFESFMDPETGYLKDDIVWEWRTYRDKYEFRGDFNWTLVNPHITEIVKDGNGFASFRYDGNRFYEAMFYGERWVVMNYKLMPWLDWEKEGGIDCESKEQAHEILKHLHWAMKQGTFINK